MSVVCCCGQGRTRELTNRVAQNAQRASRKFKRVQWIPKRKWRGFHMLLVSVHGQVLVWWRDCIDATVARRLSLAVWCEFIGNQRKCHRKVLVHLNEILPSSLNHLLLVYLHPAASFSVANWVMLAFNYQRISLSNCRVNKCRISFSSSTILADNGSSLADVLLSSRVNLIPSPMLSSCQVIKFPNPRQPTTTFSSSSSVD